VQEEEQEQEGEEEERGKRGGGGAPRSYVIRSRPIRAQLYSRKPSFRNKETLV